MVFNSLEFLIFFPIVLGLYFVLPLRYRWIMLLAASYYFYMSWNADLLFLILFTTAVSYVSAILIERQRTAPSDMPADTAEGTQSEKKKGKGWLILTLVVSLGVLFFFKYFNFFTRTLADVSALFGGTDDPLVLNLILPVGISFYTFQTLSYVIDVYRGDVKAEKHFGYYALYVSFFPQLVAGPIERPENLMPQLRAPNRPSIQNTVSGGKKMLIGFFKKVVVADLLSTYVGNVYNDPVGATAPAVIFATVLFSFQIYCDFSGYTDIAIGCSEVMGIRLMQNFDRPYTAKSVKEFWRRWHISLSSWFRDYIYFPLGGSRCSRWKRIRNVMVVFLVSGLWHGADMCFIVWGVLHGLYQVIGDMTLSYRNKRWQAIGVDPEGKALGIARCIGTFILVSFGWIFFRAASVPGMRSFRAVGVLLSGLFTGWGEGCFRLAWEQLGLTLPALLVIIFSLLVLQKLDAGALERNDNSIVGTAARYIYLVWVIILSWLLLLAGDGTSAFIYFQF